MSHAPPEPGRRCDSLFAAPPGGIQVAEAVHFRGAEKSHMHASLLQQSHHVEHLAALRGPSKIRWIAHRVEELWRRRLSDDSVLEEPDGARRVRAARDQKREHRKPHAYKDEFSVARSRAQPRPPSTR